MYKKFLLVPFIILVCLYLCLLSPFAFNYNFDTAKQLYTLKQYEKSLGYFERALWASPNNSIAKLYYIIALSRTELNYEKQEKIYKLSQIKKEDNISPLINSQVSSIINKLEKGMEDNYITNAISDKYIIHWNLSSFPLNVYIENPNDVPPYYIDNIKLAFQEWTNKTNFIKFNLNSSKEQADIYVSFKPIEKVCTNTCRYVVANTQPIIQNNKVLKRMDLIFFKTDPFKNKFSSRQVYTTAIHEIGHTLGIMGHSENNEDVMFSSENNNFLSVNNPKLTKRDLSTLVLLYRMRPDIVDTSITSNKNLYYSKLILGSDTSRLQAKLVELEDYISKYPTIPAGYINISGLYAELGDFDKAISALDKALLYATSNDELYLINFNKAVAYLNMQQFEKSKEYALSAQKLKDDESVRDLILEISEFNK